MSFDGPHRWSLRSEYGPRTQRGVLHALGALRRASGRFGDFMRRHPKRSALAVVLLLGLAIGVTVLYWRSTKRDPDHFRLRAEVPGDSRGFALAMYQSLGVRMEGGHRVELLKNGAVFPAIEQSIRGARSSIHVVMYIWEKGAASERLSRAIVERAHAGVRCRLLLDDFGSPAFQKDVAGPLTKAGCDVRIFRPMPGVDKLARNHRKLVIVDGTIAVTGGFGVRDDWATAFTPRVGVMKTCGSPVLPRRQRNRRSQRTGRRPEVRCFRTTLFPRRSAQDGAWSRWCRAPQRRSSPALNA